MQIGIGSRRRKKCWRGLVACAGRSAAEPALVGGRFEIVWRLTSCGAFPVRRERGLLAPVLL